MINRTRWAPPHTQGFPVDEIRLTQSPVFALGLSWILYGIHRIHSKIQRARVPWMNDEETTETCFTGVGV